MDETFLQTGGSITGRSGQVNGISENENAGLGARRRETKMAGLTGLEPATSCVTGRRSNQLNYNPSSTTGAWGPRCARAA